MKIGWPLFGTGPKRSGSTGSNTSTFTLWQSLNGHSLLRMRQLRRSVGMCYDAAMVRGSPNPRHLGLPARLRKARKHAGLTRRALAQQAGGGNAIALYIETGKQLPTVGTIARLALALGVSAGWLAYGQGDMYTEGPAANTEGMGARLQAVRVEQSCTKASLGRVAGLAAPSIAQIENGGQTGVETAEALAKALNISPSWLAYAMGPRELPKKRRAAKPSEPAHP